MGGPTRGDLHRSGIIHRDLKPNNILVTRDAQHIVVDLGIAKALGPLAPHLTPEHGPLGSPAYSSPEQFSGREITKASDVYSLGAILHKLATGQAPAVGRPPNKVKKNACPRDYERVMLKALQTQPEDRYQTAEELGKALDEAGAWIRWKRVGFWGFAIVLILLATGGLWVLWMWSPRQDLPPAPVPPGPDTSVLRLQHRVPPGGNKPNWNPQAVRDAIDLAHLAEHEHTNGNDAQAVDRYQAAYDRLPVELRGELGQRPLPPKDEGELDKALNRYREMLGKVRDKLKTSDSMKRKEQVK
jgi:serine/threonine protein kinase